MAKINEAKIKRPDVLYENIVVYMSKVVQLASNSRRFSTQINTPHTTYFPSAQKCSSNVIMNMLVHLLLYRVKKKQRKLQPFVDNMHATVCMTFSYLLSGIEPFLLLKNLNQLLLGIKKKQTLRHENEAQETNRKKIDNKEKMREIKSQSCYFKKKETKQNVTLGSIDSIFDICP